MSTISCSEIRSGMVLKFEGDLYRVLSSAAVTRGRATSFQVVEMRKIRDGNKNEQRFRVDDTIETAYIEKIKMNYSYHQDKTYTFLTQDTFEEIQFDMANTDFNYQFLSDNNEIEVEYCDGELIGLEWPSHARVVCQITDTDAYIKGQTAKASGKVAILNNGFKMNIPAHLVNGDWIEINPGKGTYEGVAAKPGK